MSEEIFYRPPIHSMEQRTLPAELYNLARLLISKGPGHIFVPIRSMQYLAILDHEEFIFIDGAGDRTIAIAWQKFRPDTRTALGDVVPYDAVYYSANAVQTMHRLQGDFAKALDAFAAKQPKPEEKASVTPLKPKTSA
jgi:hypothetical protein